MLKFVFIILFTIGYRALLAQTDSVTHLNEVKVYGIPVSRYSTGSKIQQIQSENGVTLTDALSKESPLFFKTYGNGQLATVAFRGTSSSHTAVMWNGINVNSPTLGQTDFSLWPSFLLEEVTLQYGSSSALYGTDAIGGSILLNQSQPIFTKQKKFEVRQEIGNFGYWLTGGKAIYGNEKIEFRTKVYYRSLVNDFPYTSPKIGFEKKQVHAAVENYGFDQQAHWKISDTKTLSFQGQYINNFREIQPVVTNDNSNDVLGDKNTRIAINYHQDVKQGSLFATLGYVLNNEVYNRNSRTRSDQLTALAQYDFVIGQRSNIRIGGNWTKYYALSSGFDGRITEDRYDAFISLRQRINSFWISSLNLRQGFYANNTAPFSPSWGNEFSLLHTKKTSLSLRSQLSRSYRVPTLNDRYWTPGGNPDLKSENGINAEVGLNFSHQIKSGELKFEFTHHRIWVDQWILWLPGQSGIWSPSNLSKVNVNGIEAGASYAFNQNGFDINTGISYSYTQSLNKNGLNEYDQVTIDKQLPYVPLNSGHAHIRASKHSWSAETQLDFTGLRYTTLDNTSYQTLDAYALLSATIGKDFSFSWCKTSLQLKANNIIGTYYENIENLAMPGRNYMLTLSVKF